MYMKRNKQRDNAFSNEIKIMAAIYITKKIPIAMVISSWVLLSGSLRFIYSTPFAADVCSFPALIRVISIEILFLMTGDPATTMIMITMAL